MYPLECIDKRLVDLESKPQPFIKNCLRDDKTQDVDLTFLKSRNYYLLFIIIFDKSEQLWHLYDNMIDYNLKYVKLFQKIQITNYNTLYIRYLLSI